VTSRLGTGKAITFFFIVHVAGDNLFYSDLLLAYGHTSVIWSCWARERALSDLCWRACQLYMYVQYTLFRLPVSQIGVDDI
jgi:hypothetical protein